MISSQPVKVKLTIDRMEKMLSDEQLLDLAYIHIPRGWSKTITECDFERSKAEYLQRIRQEINRFTLATRHERWKAYRSAENHVC